MYFSAVVDKKPEQVGTFIKNKVTVGQTEVKGPGAGLYLTFPTHKDEAVEVK